MCRTGKTTSREIATMSFVSEFREFAMKGSVVDLAVA